jgi:hypothetical protein
MKLYSFEKELIQIGKKINFSFVHNRKILLIFLTGLNRFFVFYCNVGRSWINAAVLFLSAF